MGKKVVIVGAGLVGSLHAILMAKRGHNVHVFERRQDLRKAEVIGGRSINLALSNRGFKALGMAGIEQHIRDISIPMSGRMMHSVEGELTYQAYGLEGQAIYSVSRGELNRQMLLEAEKMPNVEFHFNHKCLDIDLDDGRLFFADGDRNEVAVDADYIFGTDGAFSAVRNRMMRQPQFDYSQDYLRHGYKELEIPANADGTHKMEKNALHIWPRGEYMLIALPNLDGSWTVTLFFPWKGDPSFESLNTLEKAKQFFEDVFPDALALIPNFEQEFFGNPSASLVTIRCEPWNHGNNVLLMGDAAHAIVPFYGQGMNSGFEDCSIFAELLDQKGDIGMAIEAFAEQRKPDGDAIAELALHNYIEMRDLVADEKFLLQKKIEKRFFEKYPDKWMPLYSMVTFSHIPYSEAWSTGQRQQRIMDEVMEEESISEIWDSIEIEQLILQKLKS